MKLNGAKCPICTEGRLARHVGEFTMEYKGGSITFMDHVSYLCPSCGEDFSAGGENAKNDKSFIDFCRDIDGLLHPSHIRALREELSMTQKEMATRLEVAEKTFARYETGTVVQSRIMDKVLRVLRDHPEMRPVFLGDLPAPTGRAASAKRVVRVGHAMQSAMAQYTPFVTHEPTNLICSCELG